MGAKIYDSTSASWKDAETPKIYVGSAFADSKGMSYNGSEWVEDWGLPEAVSWSTGTDAEIVALIEAADKGIIDLHDYAGWSVGDERQVSLSAMSAAYVSESHAAQTITFVLMHQGLYRKSSDNTEVNFVVGMKSQLQEGGQVNTTNSNAGSWKNCARRAWCNDTFYNAVPASIRSIFKQVKVTTATEYNSSTVTQTDDYFFLAAAAELWKGSSWGTGGSSPGQTTTAYSTVAEFNSLTRFNYYAPSNNMPTGWTRSPSVSGSVYQVFCNASAGYVPDQGGPVYQIGIITYGCI